MKRLLCAVGLLTAALLTAGTAAADLVYHDLTIVDWMVGKKTAYTNMGNFYAGAFTWAWDGGPTNTVSPLYCLDVRNSFSGMPQTWEVSRHLVPPDPLFPPPFNTDHAAWIYYMYGKREKLTQYADPATRAAAVQVALWEVSHDVNWHATDSGWLSGGSFYLGTSTPTAVRDQANDMLGVLYTALEGGRITPPANCYWYQPRGWPDPVEGQGQIGESPIPEPGTLVLVGLGLLAAAGVARKKRIR